MELHQIKEGCYFFKGAVNIGYIHSDGKGMLIDAGLDKGTAKKIIKLLNENRLPLDFLLLTHAHTDHYGGASQLQKETEIQLFAPKLESAIMEFPILEPIYLWNGAMPIKQLRNKFLEGAPITIDGFIAEGTQKIGPFNFEAVFLPGHSYAQMGILINEIFYAADSYFGTKALEKHKVPFIVDANTTIDSLLKVRSLSFQGSVPGHGEYEENIEATIKANLDCHANIKQFLLDCLIDESAGMSAEVLLAKMFEHFHLTAREIGQWLLYRTSFTAYISSLIEDGEISISINEHVPWLKKNA